MTTINDVTRRLLNLGTIEDIECDEEGESVILVRFPDGTSAAYPYRCAGEHVYAIANAWAETKRRGVLGINYVHSV